MKASFRPECHVSKDKFDAKPSLMGNDKAEVHHHILLIIYLPSEL